jgi:hypothetical protein
MPNPASSASRRLSGKKNRTLFHRIYKKTRKRRDELNEYLSEVSVVTNVFGGIANVQSKHGALLLQSSAIEADVGFTLGNILTVGLGSKTATVSHEYGHYIQSRRFGIGYLPGFAMPSIVRAFFWGMSNHPNSTYFNFYSEKNATKLGEEYWH